MELNKENLIKFIEQANLVLIVTADNKKVGMIPKEFLTTLELKEEKEND